MINFNNKNWISDDLLKPNKNKTYYYDFGTGKKKEREEVKKTRDAFLEGFNFPETVIEREKEERNDPFVFNEPEYTHFPLASSKKPKNSWYSYLGGDLMSDRDKETFIDGLVGKNDASDRTKTTLYSELPSTYTHVTKTAQTPLEKVWYEIKEPWEERKNLLDELTRMYGDLSPEAKSAMKIVLNPVSDRNLREEAAGILENEIKRIHYGRNQYNVDLPKNKDEAEVWGWETELAEFHQNTRDPKEEPHIKYVSPDGKREVIFDYTGTRVITADEDVGTYNYADPDLWIAHAILDVLPWILYGNTPEDTTEKHQRAGGWLKIGN